jgi:hypothetical protein
VQNLKGITQLQHRDYPIDVSESDYETGEQNEAVADQSTVWSNLALVWTNVYISCNKPHLLLMRSAPDCAQQCSNLSTLTSISSTCFPPQRIAFCGLFHYCQWGLLSGILITEVLPASRMFGRAAYLQSRISHFYGVLQL